MARREYRQTAAFSLPTAISAPGYLSLADRYRRGIAERLTYASFFQNLSSVRADLSVRRAPL